MGVASMESAAASLRLLFETGTLAGLGDDRLLELIRAGGRDEAERAFAVLVERHGPMVLGVCEAVLRNRQDAEDAFQAVFLVLAQRSGTIRRGTAVASWLYGVARRVSLRSRRTLARRRMLEERRLTAIGAKDHGTQLAEGPPSMPCPELHEEVDRLPESFRAAVILCDLEGASYDSAATQLGCPVGTLQSRLARGRQRLRERLLKRGFGPESLSLGIPVARAVPPSLARQVAQAAGAVVAGGSARGLASAVAVGLASAEMQRAVIGRFLAAIGTLGLATTIVVGVMASRGRDGGPAEVVVRAVAESPPPKKVATGPIHVRVVDEQGRPAAETFVELFQGTEGEPFRSFKSNAAGIVVVPREDLDEPATLISWRGNEAFALAQIDSGRISEEEPDGSADHPVVMAIRPLTHVVDGTVADLQGKPISGVRIVAEAFRSTNSGPNGFFPASTSDPRDGVRLPRAETDDRGRFRINLPAGSQVGLCASHLRYSSPRVIASPDDRNIRPIAMRPAGIISGRVVDAETRRPIVGAGVGAQTVDYQSAIRQDWGDARTDEAGRFSIGGLLPGVYNLLLVDVPGRPNATARALEGLRVRADQSTAGLLKVMEGRPLRGIVVDRRTGLPAAKILVGCCGPARPRSGATVLSSRTDARVGFAFSVPPGEQVVYIMEAGGRFSRLERSTVEVPERGEASPVRLLRILTAPGLPIANGVMKKAAVTPTKEVISLPPDAVEQQAAESQRTVTGVVRDPDGLALRGVEINWPVEHPAESVGVERSITDRDGMFVLVNFPTKETEISVYRDGFRPLKVTVVPDGNNLNLTLARLHARPSQTRVSIRPADPIPADLANRLHFVDLTDYAEESLADSPGGLSSTLSNLPAGVRRLGGLHFKIEKFMVHLAGASAFGAPREEAGIPVRARGRAIHFLHGVQMSDKDGTEVGAYVIHYADGTVVRVPILYGRDVVNWWALRRQRPWWDWFGPDVELPTSARVAWIDEARNSQGPAGVKARLFAMTWTNPHPEKEIATLDMTSAGGACDPFVVAVTVEE